jgi:hypothetical protein
MPEGNVVTTSPSGFLGGSEVVTTLVMVWTPALGWRPRCRRGPSFNACHDHRDMEEG